MTVQLLSHALTEAKSEQNRGACASPEGSVDARILASKNAFDASMYEENSMSTEICDGCEPLDGENGNLSQEVGEREIEWRDEEFYDSPTVEYQPDDGGLLCAYISCFLSPGNGAAIMQFAVLGGIQNFALALLFLIFPVIAMAGNLFPMTLMGVWILIVAAVWIWNIAQTLRFASKRRKRSSLWRQVAIAVLSFWIPLVASFYICSDSVMQRTWMSNETMLPTIQKGDILIVDKIAFWRKEPSYGDLVLVEDRLKEKGTVRHRAFFGRIIACPGDVVQLMGAHPYVDGKPLVQYVVLPDHAPKFEFLAYEIPYKTEIRDDIQEAPPKWYPVRLPSKLMFSQTNTLKLEPEFYYVLEDNRDIFQDRIRNSYGAIVHRSEIKGKPRFVLYNTESDIPWKRYATAVSP